MTEPTMPYLRAYYHEFTITGCPAVDGVLEAIALAGKAYHHTADWGDEEKYGPDGYWGLIQLRADAAADVFKAVNVLPAEPPAAWIEAMRAEFLKSLETVSAVDLSEEETGEVKLYGGCTPATNYVTIDINDALEAAYAALALAEAEGRP